ncbi:type I-C CRISPR-associated protein Cas8c/Csd1 [Clostridium sp. Marseille-P2415]|uniref:type I-C CRISPR-associated protein Cas8c/Csd1 n=1 Tax=Clostridium sp. Marseille-P2415 TaxID=1805471 RepID=UPI00098884BA|nr:type I-C CRISPR-associated protein Cas8c/Csd1 [Clostridium sp. Marseille-P2415]
MGYMQVLHETYDKSRAYVGRMDQKGCILLPIAHSTQNAQLEIVIGMSGEWKSARKVEKAEAVTIIPVTEDSGTRSSGIAPHPLFDKLCYIAGDYEKYSSKKKAAEFYQAYMDQLEEWVQAGCHVYVKAIYSYVKKGQLIEDLVKAGILILTEAGMLREDVKIEGIVQTDAFVRFRIQDENVPGLGEVWKEQNVYDNYVNYYLKEFEKSGLDYITGQYLPCSEKQPSKIRNSADKAKLISANDSSGFTYRGRFTSKEEAVCVGYVPSQEAHNALRWLIERQGYRSYGMCVVTWNPEDEEVPDWLKDDTYDLAYAGQDILPPDLGEEYAQKIKLAIRGRYSKFEDPAKEIVVMALDAATPGRLSVTYYQQMRGSDFLNHLIYWHCSCCWIMSYKKAEAFWNKPMAPVPEDIVKAAYGVERNGLLQVDDKLMEDTLKRLMPCIVEGRSLPKDIVKSAFESACRPQAFGIYNRRKILEITCALIRKESQDRSKNKKGEFDSMSLERTNHDRDYLYGRLLATAHKFEYDTFTEAERGSRETNAERYRSRMVINPHKTWLMIDGRIQPYKRKLKIGLQVRYQKEFQDIYDMFKPGDFTAPGKLGVGFLIGYNCELSELWNWKNVSTEE